MSSPASSLGTERLAALHDVFARLDTASQRASSAVADAITSHGSPVVAQALGVCHQTALRWARRGLKVPTVSPTQSLAAALEQAQQTRTLEGPLHHDNPPAEVSMEL